MSPEEAEERALEVLSRALRENRRFTRRHMLVAMLVVLPALLGLIAVATLLASGISCR